MKKEDYNDCIGVYFLFLDKEIVYIGMSSRSVLGRIFNCHIKNYKFNSIKIINLNNSNINEIKKMEKELIKEHKPHYNKQFLKGKRNPIIPLNVPQEKMDYLYSLLEYL